MWIGELFWLFMDTWIDLLTRNHGLLYWGIGFIAAVIHRFIAKQEDEESYVYTNVE